MEKQNIEGINIDIEPTIYVKDKQYTLEEFNQIVDYLASDIEINENQQAVLSWLIDCYKDDGDPVEAISDLYDETMPTEWKTCLDAAYETFDNQQKFQLLHAFAEWGMKSE
ncbi:hypothetical protein JZO77_16690 [Enterococcus hulanensis]|uniref:hypothetical protein n=1 Tax=Enterococcus hulanensis TaxID=2559929 RepID=UPI001A8F384C|nr:hypothetical protein [Enterococcus hulanensis]MBO0458371.1 hypothetical protein [Enterococcus hulanensis]